MTANNHDKREMMVARRMGGFVGLEFLAVRVKQIAFGSCRSIPVGER